MGILENFVAKDMMEQMVILEEIKEKDQKDAIPELFELLAEKKCDQATHEMIYHTLFDLMKGDEQAIISGIRHPSFRIQLLSIRRCRRSGLSAVIPALSDLLQASSDTEVIGEIIMTLGSYKEPGLIDTLKPYLLHEDASIQSWTMEALAGIETEKVRDILIDLINSDDDLENPDKECGVATILAVEHLAKIDDKEVRDFLLSKQDHPDPAFHRAIAQALEPS